MGRFASTPEKLESATKEEPEKMAVPVAKKDSGIKKTLVRKTAVEIKKPLGKKEDLGKKDHPEKDHPEKEYLEKDLEKNYLEEGYLAKGYLEKSYRKKASLKKDNLEKFQPEKKKSHRKNKDPEKKKTKKGCDELLRTHLEELRNDHVPRYLFRVWSRSSGGGPSVSTNTPQEIVPPTFLNGTAEEFYSMDPKQVRTMAGAHFKGGTSPLSGFSSWAASLHLVLCYAASMNYQGLENVHVAVMDRYELDDEVLVWHVPHLLTDLGTSGNHEYLAYGCVRGKGYVAVPYLRLLELGLEHIFRKINERAVYDWGFTLRTAMLSAKLADISTDDVKTLPLIASEFGSLAFPVAVALLSLRPRSWVKQAKVLKDKFPERARLQECLGSFSIPQDLKSQKWLMELDMVDTTHFPDVRGWIDLLRHLVLYDMKAPRKNNKHQDAETATKKRKKDSNEQVESPIAKKQRMLGTCKQTVVTTVSRTRGRDSKGRFLPGPKLKTTSASIKVN